MALPTNESISVNMILDEMSRSAGTNSSLASLAAEWKARTGDSRFDPPHKMSDWRGQTWQVIHSLSISPDSISVPREGQTFTIQVTSNVSWSVSQTSGTLGITSMVPSGGIGNDVITVTVSQNDGQDSRGGTIIVTTGQISRTFTWTQSGGAVISPPDGGGIGSGGGSGGGDGGSDPGDTGGGTGSEDPGFG